MSNITETSADLQWKAPESDGGSPLTSYIIEVRPDSRSTWTKAGSVDGTSTSFTVPDLKVDTEYHFRVIAVNAEGQSAPLEGKETAKPTKKISECYEIFLGGRGSVLMCENGGSQRFPFFRPCQILSAVCTSNAADC